MEKAATLAEIKREIHEIEIPKEIVEIIKKIKEIGLKDDEIKKGLEHIEQIRRLRLGNFDYDVPTEEETEKLKQIRIIMSIAKQLPKDKLKGIKPSAEETEEDVKLDVKEQIKKIEKRLNIDSLYSNELKIEILHIKGIEMLKKKDYKEACKYFNEITLLNSNLKGAWLNKGVAFGGLDKFNEEIVSYKMALRIDDNYEKALNNKKIAEREREDSMR